MPRANSPIYRVPFRRRREGKTNYKKRLALLKSGKPRLVVRKLNRRIIVQVVKFTPAGDITLVTVSNEHLRKLGWMPKRNIPTAYLMGYYAGKEALKKGVEEVVLDIGLHTPTKGSLVFYALKGAIDAGLKSKLGMELDNDRMKGLHIANYAKALKEENEEKFKRIFSEYLKHNIDVLNLDKLFDKVLEKIKEV